MFHRTGKVSPLDLESIAPYALWSGSMMAHSAVDPYWKAEVRYEARVNPAAAAEIENTCLSCHAPMQQYGLRSAGKKMRLDEINEFGSEGVSCTVCHQIAPDNLGKRASLTGGFVINAKKEIYGPHQDPFPMPMRMHTGRTPTEAKHITESALCGSCHTVITPTLDDQGRRSGEFLEQATYPEWLASGFPALGKTCQSCHTPVLRDQKHKPSKSYIAHTPHGGYFGRIRPRTPFGLHTFSGANVQVLGMLAEEFPDKRRLLERSAEQARQTLRDGAALRLQSEMSDTTIVARVTLVNRTGHKLPTGFPSRRMWLDFRIEGQGGTTIFRSGEFDQATGEIKAMPPGGFVPHRDRITSSKQTAVYEAEMADNQGHRIVSLMRAARMVKDNRILPLGFQEDRLPEDMKDLSISPMGVESDPNFKAGSDEVTYEVKVGDQAGPFRVVVELLYQSIKPSHALAMDKDHSREESRFLELFARHNAPVVVARQEVEVR